MDLAQLLPDLDARLSAAGALVTGHWRPGVGRDDVDAALAAFGLRAPEEVVTWFAWHDGTDTTPFASGESSQSPENVLIGQWFVLTLAQAVVIRRKMWALYQEIEWHVLDEIQTWFPVLAWYGSPLLCVDCGGDPSLPAPVYILDPWGDDYSGSPQYASLAHFVAEAINLFDTGITRPDPQRPGVVDVDRTRAPGYW